MIRYTVVWHKLAEDELAELWLQATNRAEFTQAANRIDRELAEDADKKGTFVVLDIFEYTVAPLTVLFRFSTPDRLASVLYVKLAK